MSKKSDESFGCHAIAVVAAIAAVALIIGIDQFFIRPPASSGETSGSVTVPRGWVAEVTSETVAQETKTRATGRILRELVPGQDIESWGNASFNGRFTYAGQEGASLRFSLTRERDVQGGYSSSRSIFVPARVGARFMSDSGRYFEIAQLPDETHSLVICFVR